ncbi:MAG: ABC transporter ATP-binding protein [Dehalococcoidales bacterium]|nr:ABC transporter ATP-binding protein [Dehalococcoidales bacterium]
MISQPFATASVRTRGLTMVYGDRTVLDITSLEVIPGEVLAIIGPNGSGKTTLLLNLALLIKPTKGMVFYDNIPITGRKQMLELRRRTATVFQEPLLLAMSVKENVTLGLKLRKIRDTEAKQRARKWLERFGVINLENRSPRTLSSGEAKRVSLARAFALQPEVLFLDEPFTALDSPTRQALLNDFERVLRETKVTTVMVTHDRNEALVVAHRVAVLLGGKLRQLGAPDEVFNYPVDEEVAEFVEAGNILDGKVIEQSNGMGVVSIGTQLIEVVSPLPAGTRVTVCLRFEDITLAVPPTSEVSSSARNRLNGVITKVLPLAAQARITLNCGFPLTALITKRSCDDMKLGEGKEVIATFKASIIHLIPHY